MQASNQFKQIIENHLKGRAAEDALFAETLKKPNKNIGDCITYILNQVKKSGKAGFADDEIFGMAVHYYDENDIKPGDKINATVVVNHSIELSEDDKKAAHKAALDKAIAQEEQRLAKKPVKKVQQTTDQPTLF